MLNENSKNVLYFNYCYSFYLALSIEQIHLTNRSYENEQEIPVTNETVHC